MSDNSNDNNGNSDDREEKPPISLIERQVNKQEAEAAALIRSIKFLEQNIDNLTRAYKIQARIRKRIYDAYIEAGFDPKQALELCQHDK